MDNFIPLYEQLFSSIKEGRAAVDRSIKHLCEQKLWGKEVTNLPDVAIMLLTPDNMYNVNWDSIACNSIVEFLEYY